MCDISRVCTNPPHLYWGPHWHKRQRREPTLVNSLFKMQTLNFKSSVILGDYWNNGLENGNYFSRLGSPNLPSPNNPLSGLLFFCGLLGEELNFKNLLCGDLKS